ncbi:hypothetical protein NQ117_16865 [Paenibacillus sp. SC116]|uniref:hypothetical protein n=1 Tax=Paenibacillus sp. SC116 TaxID=2968986 RepID=UPI00215B1AC2|nr:hypothetical protein [Paenibacillus sp. SC116]MCR8845355.1 hypothetical protein [Paenibacillus sp. SC116]
MSMPTIPDIKPEIVLSRHEVINLLLTSIALEEIGLSHIINAESESIQALLKDSCVSLDDALKINHSVERMMRSVIQSQMLLQIKLDDIISLDNREELA